MAAPPKQLSKIRKFNIVVAATKNMHGIGTKGTLPWRLPKDMNHFKMITSQTQNEVKRNAVIMGRTTWESIPQKFRPLAGRLNIVLSRTLSQADLESTVPSSSTKKDEMPMVCKSFDDALNALSWGKNKEDIENVFVIGGQQIYETASVHPHLDKAIVTEVQKDFDCDTFFNLLDYDLEESKRGEMVEDKSSSWQLVDYKRKKNSIPWNPKGDVQNKDEIQYLELIRDCIENGAYKGDRTGTGVYSVFGRSMRFNLQDNIFPLLTTKNTFWRGVAEELIWFVNGSTNANLLADKDIHIWDGNGSREFLDNLGFQDREVGDLGPVYGFQWRNFGAEYEDMYTNYEGKGVDQLMSCINQIKNNPESRRIIMSAWNPMAQKKMALPPCHILCQFYVANGKLSCQMYQRSGDVGLGIPFNIASYSLLTRMIAQVCGLDCGEFIHVIGDAHVYSNHVEPLRKQIIRNPRPFPKLYMNPNINDIEKFTYDDFEIVGYKPYPKISMTMAV